MGFSFHGHKVSRTCIEYLERLVLTFDSEMCAFQLQNPDERLFQRLTFTQRQGEASQAFAPHYALDRVAISRSRP